LTFVCFVRSSAKQSYSSSIDLPVSFILMENSSTTNEKTPSSTPSIDERDLVMSMRKLDLIKELG